MIPKELISIENLKNEDQHFCQHFWGLEKSEISSWNSESIKLNTTDQVKPKKKLQKKRVNEKRGKQDLEVKPNFLTYSRTGEVNDGFKVGEQARINPCDRFKQLGFNNMQPEFCADKAEQVDKCGKYRSMSLGNSKPDPDFDHFGCRVPVKTKVNGRQKNKINVYTDSYYGKFFLDTESYQNSENPKEQVSKFSNQPKTVKLPSLRNRSTISDTLKNYQIGKSVFNFPLF